jgi:uncharacterized protein YqjF (DUF2071 family)
MQAWLPRKILSRTEHRPYPLPRGPWALFMSWHDLLFMHWRVPEGALRPLVPSVLELDTFDGGAWLGITPFRMSGTRPRFLPSVPPLSNFPELNVRTYVTAGGRPGIWFFSLDAHNRIRYGSVRTHRGAPGARFAGRYRPVGDPFNSRPGTLEHFLTERYCLYSASGRGNVYRGDIHHHPWPLQRAEIEIESLAMTEQIGVALPETEPLLHFSRRLDTLAWSPRRIDS